MFVIDDMNRYKSIIIDKLTVGFPIKTQINIIIADNIRKPYLTLFSPQLYVLNFNDRNLTGSTNRIEKMTTNMINVFSGNYFHQMNAGNYRQAQQAVILK